MMSKTKELDFFSRGRNLREKGQEAIHLCQAVC